MDYNWWYFELKIVGLHSPNTFRICGTNHLLVIFTGIKLSWDVSGGNIVPETKIHQLLAGVTPPSPTKQSTIREKNAVTRQISLLRTKKAMLSQIKAVLMRSLYLEKSIQVSQIILFNLHSITHITFIVRKEPPSWPKAYCYCLLLLKLARLGKESRWK